MQDQIEIAQCTASPEPAQVAAQAADASLEEAQDDDGQCLFTKIEETRVSEIQKLQFLHWLSKL